MNMEPMHDLPQVLRLPAVKRLTGLGRSTIYEAMRRGEFPRSLKLDRRAAGWLRSDLERWLSARVAERDAPTARTEG